MISSYHLTGAAAADLELIWDYTMDRWGLSQADDYLRRLHAAFARRPEFPATGRAVDDVRHGYRALPVGAHCVFYRMSDDVIEVVRILHGRMNARGRFSAGQGDD